MQIYVKPERSYALTAQKITETINLNRPVTVVVNPRNGAAVDIRQSEAGQTIFRPARITSQGYRQPSVAPETYAEFFEAPAPYLALAIRRANHYAKKVTK